MRVQLDPLEDLCSFCILVLGFIDVGEGFTDSAVLFFKGDDLRADLVEGVDVDVFLNVWRGEFGDCRDVFGKDGARGDDANTFGEDCVDEYGEVGG